MTARILLVDDEEDIHLLCGVNLELEGFEVLNASNGADALDVVRRDRPDLVLLDVMMPVMDGWRCLQAMKEDPALRQIPVVMLSAKANGADRLRGLSCGAAEYVTKPFNPLAIVDTVRSVLAADESEREDRRRASVRHLGQLQRI